MQIFVTYAREDRARVGALLDDLKQGGYAVWMDHALRGGQAWWDTICAQIVDCEIYLFQLSPASLASRACRAEYEYALALGRPTLMVVVADVDPGQHWPEMTRNPWVDLRTRSVESAIALVTALSALPPAPPLPEPMPVPPAVPMTYLSSLHDRVRAPRLTPEEQAAIVEEITGHLGQDDERDAARGLLQTFGSRSDLTPEVARSVRDLVDQQRSTGAVTIGRRHPSIIPIAVLAAIGWLTLGIPAVIAIVMAGRAIRDIDAQPGRFRGRRWLVALRILAVASIVGALLYSWSVIRGSR